MIPQFYSRYNPAPQVAVEFDEPSMTQQHFADECDINNILAKFVKTGILENIGPGVYADVAEAGDYLDAIETIRRADEEFSSLPSHIRKEFDNSPANFLAFVADEKNRDRAVEIGLINQPKNQQNHTQTPAPTAPSTMPEA